MLRLLCSLFSFISNPFSLLYRSAKMMLYWNSYVNQLSFQLVWVTRTKYYRLVVKRREVYISQFYKEDKILPVIVSDEVRYSPNATFLLCLTSLGTHGILRWSFLSTHPTHEGSVPHEPPCKKILPSNVLTLVSRFQHSEYWGDI